MKPPVFKSILADVKGFLSTGDEPLIVVLGPTASGKSSLGVALAKEVGGEVISADSRQVYKGMNIGTGTVTPAEMDGVPHHLINIFAPDEHWSAFSFKEQTEAVIADCWKRGVVPIIVGGTGLYLNSLLYDYELDTLPADEVLRSKLEERLLKEGGEVLWKELQEQDPEAAERIHANNSRRVIRALEMIALTGSAQPKRAEVETPKHHVYMIGLEWSREELYSRINQRHEDMFEQGLIEEVQELLKLYPQELKAFETIGYQEVIQFLNGDITEETCKELVKQHARNYAKRQMTWFRRMAGVHWYSMD